MTAPRREPREPGTDPRERWHHEETVPGIETNWACLPVSVAVQREAEARQQDAGRFEKIMTRNHYVAAIEYHNAAFDVLRCGCGWTGTPAASVIAAVREWVRHVLSDPALASEPDR